MKIPGSIIQGDTVTWRDAPTRDNLNQTITSGEWTLTWHFNGPTKFSIVATPYEDGWETTISAAQSEQMTPLTPPSTRPNYFWQATATDGDRTVTIGTGAISVLKNLATAPASFDGRSQAERDLAAVQQAIQARIKGGVIHEYVIGTRRLRNEPMTELLALESRLKLIVSRERRAQLIANGLGDPRNTFVRFN